MKTLPALLQRKSMYFGLFLLVLVFGGLLTSTGNKIDCFILLNSLHVKWLDIFFTFFTLLGDGIFSIAVVLILLFIKKLRPLSFCIMTAYLTSGIAAQVLKKLFNAPRPKEIISPHFYTNFIDGVTGSGWDSFPSGHTTSVFALATLLALHASNRIWGLCFLMVATGVGYSRVYLGQHFLPDVMAGAFIGVLTGLIVYLVYARLHENIRNRKKNTTSAFEENFYSPDFAGNQHR